MSRRRDKLNQHLPACVGTLDDPLRRSWRRLLGKGASWLLCCSLIRMSERRMNEQRDITTCQQRAVYT